MLDSEPFKTHGATAWNEISACQQRMNGRQAYRKLRARFMGEDVQHLLRTHPLEPIADVADFDVDIALRGRLAGHFWAADNRRLFVLADQDSWYHCLE